MWVVLADPATSTQLGLSTQQTWVRHGSWWCPHVVQRGRWSVTSTNLMSPSITPALPSSGKGLPSPFLASTSVGLYQSNCLFMSYAVPYSNIPFCVSPTVPFSIYTCMLYLSFVVSMCVERYLSFAMSVCVKLYLSFVQCLHMCGCKM